MPSWGLWVVIGFFSIFMLVIGDVLISGIRQQNRLSREGLPAQAKILAVQETGNWAANNPMVKLTAEIRRDDGAAVYVATFSEMVPVIRTPLVQPGSTVRVLVLPDKPDKIEVVWSN
jgi:hypothetical protein